MREEKHAEVLEEVEETIQQALGAPDILRHQRRLAAMLSLGAQQLVELHLHNHRAIKPGAHIKHEWFALGERFQRLDAVLTKGQDAIPQLSELLVLARTVEKDRNDHLYSSPLSDDDVLREKIDAFLEMKKVVYGQKP